MVGGNFVNHYDRRVLVEHAVVCGAVHLASSPHIPPAMGAVFYLGVGWPQWKPLGIPGTHLPLKRGSWLNFTTFIDYG